MTDETLLARGYTERVGKENAIITYWINNEKVLQSTTFVPTFREAVRHALEFLTISQFAPLSELAEIEGIGFKTIQAGEKNGSVFLTDDVLLAMEEYKDLAPAHNPPYLSAIYMFQELLPNVPLVGVFEPGFHVHVPQYAKIYGTPYDWIENYNVVQYGYHGASHRYITQKTVDSLALPSDDHKVISCHLGGSSSLCAYKNGISIDVSMGFSPQSGLVQGSRVGDIDPFVLPYIMERKKISLSQALDELGKKGGLAGLSGISDDMRDIVQAINSGNKRAKLARDKFIYDIKRYIGEYIVIMEGIDAIAFAGGIGQKDSDLRKQVLSSLCFLGMKLDEKKNEKHEFVISAKESRIAALVVGTNEEIIVARETVRVIKEQG